MKLPNGYGTVRKLSGKRRRPFQVIKTAGWEIDKETGKAVQNRIVIGYTVTRAEGLQLLAEYNKAPFDAKAAKATFKDVYEAWSKRKYLNTSDSSVKAYTTCFNACSALHDKTFKDIKLADLQDVVDSCGKNYPTLRKLKLLFSQLYGYALQNDICAKDYSKFVDIVQYKDKNPNSINRNPFTDEEIKRLWEQKDAPYHQVILMLIYTGVRIGELLELKKENVNLEERYFDIVASKTENGIRRVPIADKVMPFFEEWCGKSDCERLIHSAEGKPLEYYNYRDTYWDPIMADMNINHRPHDTRHTCISMLANAHADPTFVKKIIGHKSQMSLTERVYTHLDMEKLLETINLI